MRLPVLNPELEEKIITNLKMVYDPEIPVNIYDLGMIYEIVMFEDTSVEIKMTLTSPNCPVAESLPAEVRHAAEAVHGVGEVRVELTFDPPWSMEMMTEAAKLELGML